MIPCEHGSACECFFWREILAAVLYFREVGLCMAPKVRLYEVGDDLSALGGCLHISSYRFLEIIDGLHRLPYNSDSFLCSSRFGSGHFSVRLII
jgi:hypothetical protein